MVMCTALSLDDEVMASVREMAEAHGLPLGRVVSDLLRSALQPTPRLITGPDGLPMVAVPDGARPITGESVARKLASP